MRVPRPAGNGAAARKYDLLTALGSKALASSPAEQRVVLRLMVAITARYNWATDTLAVAQADLARMWSVDERTVKRMMSRYRERGWLKLKRQAVRGRVAEYGLGLEALLVSSRDAWSRIGPDFEARLSPDDDRLPSPTVVPFPAPAPEAPEGRLWPRLHAQMAMIDPATAKAWLHGVCEEGIDDGVLRLSVPGRYQANYLRTHVGGELLELARRFDPRIRAVEVCVRPS